MLEELRIYYITLCANDV